MRKTKILSLCECAVMLALSIVLSYIVIWRMPMGGGITLLSMLPVMLVSAKNGLRAGLLTSFLFAAFQLAQGIASGDVFVHCTTWVTVLIVAVFDYIAPYTALGLAALARKKQSDVGTFRMNFVFGAIITFRFVCHFITGFTIWGQWAPEGMGKYLYSLIYNGQYMLPELILTLIGANLVLAVPQMKKLISGK